MTHIDNLPAIAAAGGLLPYNQMRGSAYFNLSNQDVQAGRAAITVPGAGRALHDYVPLYFGFKTPMVAWNQAKNESLIFLRFPLDVLGIPGTVVTDGNARSRDTQFKAFRTIDALSIVDAKAVQTVKYAGDDALKRRKQAEILIPDSLPLAALQDVICFTESARNLVLEILRKNGIKKPAFINQGWYFLPRNLGT